MEEKEYTPEIYPLADENGNVRDYEVLDVIEEKGVLYYALAPYAKNPEELLESDRGIYAILKLTEKDGSDVFDVLDEEEEERIGAIFDERFASWEEEEDEETESI